MKKFATRAFLAAMMSGVAGAALAADLYEPPVVEAAPEVVVRDVSYGGWYIRGDLDYHRTDFRGADYDTYGFNAEGDLDVSRNGELDGDIDESWSAGLGVGYQITKHLRTDLTLDHFGKADFHGDTYSGSCPDGFGGFFACSSRDKSSLSAWLLLANAYVDLGTYHGFTPYVGAGIGGAHIKWDKLRNSVDGVPTVEHDGNKEWRFAYALMAGTAYCLTKNLNLDVGYRFSHIEGGKMFDYARTFTGGPDIGAGPGDDDGFNVHEVRGGLRYQFGEGNPDCGEPETVAYEPPPAEPVYK